MELIQPGWYDAKILDYGIKATKSGAPQVTVTFGVKSGDKEHRLYWNSSFTEKALKFTLKALVNMGLSTAVEEMADGPSSNALDMTKSVRVEVEHNTYNNETTARVCSVAKSSGDNFRALMSKTDVRAKLGSLNLKGELAAVRNELGIKPTSPAPVAKTPAADFDPNFDLGDTTL